MNNDNNDNQKKGWLIIVCVIAMIAMVSYMVYYMIHWSIQHGFVNKDDTTIILAVVGIILTVVGIILAVAQLKNQNSVLISNNNINGIKNKDSQETQENEAVKVNQCGFWMINRKWIILFLVASLLFLIAICYNIHEYRREIASIEQHCQDSIRQDSIQRCFDELVAIYDFRMKEELPSYDNVCPSINDDFDLLLEILQLLNEHPNLNALPKIQYIGQFKNRAEAAIAKIRNAIYSTHLTESMRDEMIMKYTPCINSIEKSIDSIEKNRNGL